MLCSNLSLTTFPSFAQEKEECTACTSTMTAASRITRGSLAARPGTALEVRWQRLCFALPSDNIHRAVVLSLSRLGAGVTPWGTWVSCEEYGNGQVRSRRPPTMHIYQEQRFHSSLWLS